MCRGINDPGGPWRCAAHTRPRYLDAISDVSGGNGGTEKDRIRNTEALTSFACTPSGQAEMLEGIEIFEEFNEVENAMWMRSCLQNGKNLAEAHKDSTLMEKILDSKPKGELVNHHDSAELILCSKCSLGLDSPTHTGLCRDCFVEEYQREGSLMGLNNSDALAWAKKEADFDVKQFDEDLLDIDIYGTVFDESSYFIPSKDYDPFLEPSSGGGGTKYGYDDFEQWEDFRTAERNFAKKGGNLFGANSWAKKYPAAAFPYVDYRKKYEDQARETGLPVPVAMGSKTSGDGYVYFPDGSRRWGIYGASGVLIRNVDTDGTERFFLAQRGGSVEGGKGQWAIPGGALDLEETPAQGALREFREEIKSEIKVNIRGEHKDETVLGWVYTSMVADSPVQFAPPEKLDWETQAVGWFTRKEMAELPKYEAFAETLPILFDKFDLADSQSS